MTGCCLVDEVGVPVLNDSDMISHSYNSRNSQHSYFKCITLFSTGVHKKVPLLFFTSTSANDVDLFNNSFISAFAEELQKAVIQYTALSQICCCTPLKNLNA